MSSIRSRHHYDAVIVGARAGAASALLLARAGLRVLVVDRSRPGTDTLSLRDGELLARAVVDGARDGNEAAALAGYEWTRNRLSEPLFTITDAIASHRWDTAEVGALLLALSDSMAAEVRTLASLDDTVLALAS